MGSKQQIPVRDGLWKNTEKGPRLVGSMCKDCGELFFPKKGNNICTYCQSRNLEEVEFSTHGKVYSYTCVMQRPPDYYKGDVPYIMGYVELPEGIRIEALFTGCDIEDVHVGMDMELVIEKLYENEDGNEVVTYKFRPAV